MNSSSQGGQAEGTNSRRETGWRRTSSQRTSQQTASNNQQRPATSSSRSQQQAPDTASNKPATTRPNHRCRHVQAKKGPSTSHQQILSQRSRPASAAVAGDSAPQALRAALGGPQLARREICDMKHRICCRMLGFGALLALIRRVVMLQMKLTCYC